MCVSEGGRDKGERKSKRQSETLSEGERSTEILYIL